MSLSRPAARPLGAPPAPAAPPLAPLGAQVAPDPGGGLGPPPGEGEGADLRVPTLADGGNPLDPTQSLAPGGEVGTTPLLPAPGSSAGGDVSDSVSPMVVMGLGAVLVLGALLYWVFGGGGRASGGRPGGDRRALERLRAAPEPGLLHPALPSLSDGLAVWVAPAELQDGLITALLAELARGRTVLVAAPARVVLPLVHGGPVYRVEGGRPQQLKRAAAGLGGERAAALIVGPEGAAPALDDWAEALPPGVGGLVLLAERPAGWSAPVVELQRVDGEDDVLHVVLGARRLRARLVGGALRVEGVPA